MYCGWFCIYFYLHYPHFLQWACKIFMIKKSDLNFVIAFSVLLSFFSRSVYCIPSWTARSASVDWWHWETLAPSNGKCDDAPQFMPLKSLRAAWKLRKCDLCFLWHVSGSLLGNCYLRKEPSFWILCFNEGTMCNVHDLRPRKGKERRHNSPKLQACRASTLIKTFNLNKPRGYSCQKACQKFKSGNL